VPYWLHVLVRGAARGAAPARASARALDGTCCGSNSNRHDLEGFVGVARHFGQDRYGYVVTANVDHVIRMHRWPALRKLYASPHTRLLDSRFLAHLLRLVRGLVWPVCAGSDLTARVLQDAGARDRIVLIGGDEAQAKRLAAATV
jgi:UDP-N-acetyl-D-mannosaminuronic acid transferase (WecB/TagA/CpsF family)